MRVSRKWALRKICLATLVFSLVFFTTVGSALACTTIIVGKNKTEDGSVLVAHSEELGLNSAQHLVAVPRKEHAPGEVYVSYAGARIPQPPVTYAYIASRIFEKDYYPGEYTTGVNEFQVTVANNMSWTRGVPEETAWEPPIAGGVIWSEFTHLVLERARTAREGVEIMGELCEKYHLSSDPGTMFAIADPNEGWWIEIARDGQWIAQRVPNDAAVMRANSYRVGAVDLNDKRNIMHSSNLVEYAVAKGWYNPESGKPFSFAEVYGEPSNQEDEYNNLRHRMVDEALTGGKISKARLMEIMRWTYEGTPVYKANEETGSPFRTGVRTVSRMNTEISAVAELRGGMPADIGAVMWWNLGTARTGVYVPWYLGTREFCTPFTRGTNHYSDDSAYWAYAEMARLTDAHYNEVIDKVTSTWKSFEANEFALQKGVEAQALEMYKRDPDSARQFLTWYSNALGERSYRVARELLADVKTEAYKEE
ncbi:MAG: hypothetical protein HPY55_00565 [Firmicutes bacterium]|nr:hypothetical protein [Bacillota bacterium]